MGLLCQWSVNHTTTGPGMCHAIAYAIIACLILLRYRWNHMVEGVVEVILGNAKSGCVHRIQLAICVLADIFLEDCQTSFSQESSTISSAVAVGTMTETNFLEVDIGTKLDTLRQGLQNCHTVIRCRKRDV